jgi:FKBP-type peptidyl-prolyl cis-trans isomerase SlyD
MNIVKDRVVSIDYTLTDKNDRFIDSTSSGEPLDYLHGYENIIPGLEKALEGRSVGDHFLVVIPMEEAYGNRDEALVTAIPLDRFEGETVEEGMQFQAQTPDGFRVVTVTKVEDQSVTIDANHPLAGMDLNFEVTVTAIREASAEELAHGHIHSHAHSHDCDECGGCGHGDCGHGGSL